MAKCSNHPYYTPMKYRDGKWLRGRTEIRMPNEPNHEDSNEDCFICWTNYIESKYADNETPVEGRDMVKLMRLFNREMASGSISRDTGFTDPQYER